MSSFYNTPERVASLLVKITNQVIRSCKKFITENGSLTIWNQDREAIEKKLTECIKLNSQYRDAYHKIKGKKVGRERKEFSFSEKYIFGRFDSFCLRLKNLLDMFNTINQFSDLFKSRMEALLAEDALTGDSKKFNAAVKQLTEKDYDYLDFRNLSFDRDYNDFLSKMDDLTSTLQVTNIIVNQKSGFNHWTNRRPSWRPPMMASGTPLTPSSTSAGLRGSPRCCPSAV